MTPSGKARVRRFREMLFAPPLKPWKTVRDAISDLPDPKRANDALNHQDNPGAKAYAGHMGSPLDEPAKTLKAGDHVVPELSATQSKPTNLWT